MNFDPHAYIAEVRANPEQFVKVADLIAQVTALHSIRHARTLEILAYRFQVPAKAAKASGDTELLERLKEAAAKRKGELQN